MLRINEVLASNVTVFPDNVDFDDYSDWIELHNSGTEALALHGYFLSDDSGDPLRWAFPPGSSIPAGGYLVVRADGYDAAPGERHRREYSPWATFTTDHFHTNFKLGAEGEELLLVQADPNTVGGRLPLLDAGSEWRYLDDGSDQGRAWTGRGFDDSAWQSGNAQFGYGEDDEATTISFGPDSDNKFLTTYFRATFEVANLSAIESVALNILVDDGAVIHVNGTETHRVRMPAGDIDYLTDAEGSPNEGVFDNLVLDRNVLIEGENTIAVEVHQGSGSSSDVSFDLEIIAQRAPSVDDYTVVDSVTFGQQWDDVSFGRSAADPAAWTFFGEPTPGAANATSAAERPDVQATPVLFSIPGGFHADPVTVALSLPAGAPDSVIHYTLDGSWPTSESPAYAEPLALDITTVVRARAFSASLVPGPVQTETFFVNEPASVLPVVSFVVDPGIFFDSSLGIYRNVHKGREAPVNLAWFEPDGTMSFHVNAGSRIGGENIWRFAQKPLSIAMRGKYGDDAVAHQLFPGLRLASFTRFNFRNGGDNWDDDMLRDALTPDIMRGQMRNEVEDYRPVVLYMNGEYWGIHNVRKDLDPAYFTTVYHVGPDGYDHLEFGHLNSSAVELGAKEGTVEDYLALEDYARSNDLADPAHWAYMESRMDMESFMDFVIIEDYVNNTSWAHNREFWRDRREGGKWQWIVPDLDRGLNISNVTTSLLDNWENDYRLFGELVENPDFLNRLAQRYCAHLGSTFHPDRIADIVDRRDAEVLPEVPRHVAKWRGDGGMSLNGRQGELAEIKQFARERPAHIYGDFAQNFDMPGTVPLTVEVAAGTGGRVLLNGVPVLPQYGTTTPVFEGLPCHAIAEPAPGYHFLSWSNGATTARIDFAVTAEMALTATFFPTGETILPPVIDTDRTLAAGDYVSNGTITVPAGVTLTIDAGVTLRLPQETDIRVAGALRIAGTAEAPVRVEPLHAGTRWGAIAFVDADAVSSLSHVIVRGGSVGANPLDERGAISIVRSEVNIDHLDIDEGLIPVFVWYGKVAMRDSTLRIPFTGDCINVKHGEGLVENCTFIGNTAVDTDAIDFDDVVNGIIRGNRIYAFRGPNSDGIDVGEGCVNLLIAENRIYNNSDKGISVGQGSTTRIERNLIVGCELGIGIKDAGSFAEVDQNTFVGNAVPVAVYEKNLGSGGGAAVVTNSIFSRSKLAPFTQDSLSTVSVTYSLSDTLPMPGAGNLVADPGFTDPGRYDFSLLASSAAIDAGDPAHAGDADGTRVDIGAGYLFDPDDYPFIVPNVIVINEVLSHSAEGAPDWIELFNTSGEPVDIGGWYLSDSRSDLQKYRIADGTTIPAHGHVVFYEDSSFGDTSSDPGKQTAFALNENGESVYLHSPGDGLLLAYLEEEAFGPSPTGVSRGRYRKSTNTYNFVFMAEPTPGAPNSAPLVGPVVISEIMYRPQHDGDAEYLELANISDRTVLLHDEAKNAGWSFTDGITFEFPAGEQAILAPGERLLLVRDAAAFSAQFTVPEGTRVLQWTSGGLSNGGEGIELSRPGDVDEAGVRQWVRIDRVNYGDDTLWPVEADGRGMSLTRADEDAYGNDVVNWIAALPTPGTGPATVASGFDAWATSAGLPADARAFNADPDGDGQGNGLEYAIGTDPMRAAPPVSPAVTHDGGNVRVSYGLSAVRDDISYTVQQSEDLTSGWIDLSSDIEPADAGAMVGASVAATAERSFFRLRVERK